MGSRPLMLKNKSQPFIRVKDKSLSCFATDKEGTKTVFIGRTMLGNVFIRESICVFDTVRDVILA